MGSMLTDRQRCESSFIGRLIYVLILGGVQSGNHQGLADMALEVCESPLRGLFNPGAIKRRVIRMEQNTILPLSGKAHGEKVLLVCYFFINKLVDDGIIEMPEESQLALLVDHLLSLINPEDDVVKKRMKSAEKQAARWLEILRKDGYYGG